MKKFEQQILEFLSQPAYKPVKRDKLADKLGLAKKLLPKHQQALQSLIDGGAIFENKKGRLKLKSAAETVAGVIKRTASGIGFLIPHEPLPGGVKGDVFISRNDIHDAHDGDEVLVRLLKRRGGGGRICGRVDEILQRATSTFVGTYFEDGGEGYVRADGRTFNDPIFVGDPGAKGVRPDDKVVIEMVRFPSQVKVGEAVLTEVLGPRGEPGIDTLSTIREFGLPTEFPEHVLADAHRQADRFDENDVTDRLDLTNRTIVTIDPADARDFDDAISLEQSKDGHWHLGVHIADVAHFVQPGSALDKEALLRTTSVYLPQHVIPMLPEVISNSLASLQQGKLRYVKSVFIEYNEEGIPVHTEFANSAIKVTQRFAYEEVMPIVQQPDRFRSRVSAKVRALLPRMHKLAMILRARRFKAGALELNLPEVKVDFDKDGRVCGAHESEHDESHQIIEEFMLAANIAVATHLADRGAIFLRRVHPDPDMRKLRLLSEFTKAIGFPLESFQSRSALQSLVNRVRGEPAEHAVNYALLRSMKPAEYSADDFGHYALGVENYCHFTSPIRRYPDLTVHRLIDAICRKKRRAPGMEPNAAAKLGKHCSSGERRAAAAERELIKVKLLTYMASRIGEEMDAVITGVERFGLFCQGIEFPIDGFVHVTAIDANDYFDYDAATYSMTGRRRGKVYRLGDPLRVIVAHVDVDRRELDFRIAPGKSTSKRKAKSKPTQPPSKQRAASKVRIKKKKKGTTTRRTTKKPRSAGRKQSKRRKKT